MEEKNKLTVVWAVVKSVREKSGADGKETAEKEMLQPWPFCSLGRPSCSKV